MKSLLPSTPVLWFLFSFNLMVALAIGFEPVADTLGLDGTNQIAAAVGMGVVALGAGATLLRRRRPTI